MIIVLTTILLWHLSWSTIPFYHLLLNRYSNFPDCLTNGFFTTDLFQLEKEKIPTSFGSYVFKSLLPLLFHAIVLLKNLFNTALANGPYSGFVYFLGMSFTCSFSPYKLEVNSKSSVWFRVNSFQQEYVIAVYFVLHHIGKHTMSECPRAIFCAGAMLCSTSSPLTDIFVCLFFPVVCYHK